MIEHSEFVKAIINDFRKHFLVEDVRKVYEESKFRNLEDHVYKDNSYKRNVIKFTSRIVDVVSRGKEKIEVIAKVNFQYETIRTDLEFVLEKIMYYFLELATLHDLILVESNYVLKIDKKPKECSWKNISDEIGNRCSELYDLIEDLYVELKEIILIRNEILHEFNFDFSDRLFGEKNMQISRQLYTETFRRIYKTIETVIQNDMQVMLNSLVNQYRTKNDIIEKLLLSIFGEFYRFYKRET